MSKCECGYYPGACSECIENYFEKVPFALAARRVINSSPCGLPAGNILEEEEEKVEKDAGKA